MIIHVKFELFRSYHCFINVIDYCHPNPNVSVQCPYDTVDLVNAKLFSPGSLNYLAHDDFNSEILSHSNRIMDCYIDGPRARKT